MKRQTLLFLFVGLSIITINSLALSFPAKDNTRVLARQLPSQSNSPLNFDNFNSGETDNLVKVDFVEEVNGYVSGDTFYNSELTGDRVWRIAAIRNTDDETGAPVKDLRIVLNSEMTFDGISRKEHLTTMETPIYEWSYGDLVEESQRQEWYVDAVVMASNYHSTITPGFDASRSFDKTTFTAPNTQTLTITVTPREEWLEKVTVCVIADENDLVDPIIKSYSPTGAEDIKLTANDHRLALNFIPVELNIPLTITITIQVTPKVSSVTYKPQMTVIPERQIEADTGTTKGSSVSYTMPDVGTWTVSAKGDYVWNWGKTDWVRGTIMFEKMIKSNESNQQFVAGGVAAAGVVIIGLVMYSLIRRRRRKRATY